MDVNSDLESMERCDEEEEDRIGDPLGYPETGGGFSSCACKLPVGRRIGRMTACCQGGRGLGYRCVVGPCWAMAAVTLMLICGVGVLLVNLVSGRVPSVVLAALIFFVTATVVLFVLTAVTDPGITPYQPTPPPPPASWTFHTPTSSYQPPGTKYCQECGVFVEAYDHFCPWTGTTIGRGNLRYFYLFVCSMCCTLGFVLVCLLVGEASVHK